jgi:hypothetical protein
VSLANVTFLTFRTGPVQYANTVSATIAATCVLYHGIRGYVTSITTNNLSELQTSTAMAWPISFENDIFTDVDFPVLGPSCYAGAVSPCRVNYIIYTTQNMSTAPNATTILTYEAIPDGTVQSKYVSAPEPCIYRLNGAFAEVLGSNLDGIISNSSCGFDAALDADRG